MKRGFAGLLGRAGEKWSFGPDQAGLPGYGSSGTLRFLPDGLALGTFGPVGCCAFVVRSYQEVVQVDVAYILVGCVREWTREQCPGEPRVSDMAVSIALSSYFGGASVAEACEQARSFVLSRAAHPARNGNRPVAVLSIAS